MSVTPPYGRMFSSAEAAEFLGMPMPRLRRLVAARKIPVIRDGRLAFLEQDLRDWLTAHRTPATEDRPSTPIPSTVAPARPAGDISDLMPAERRLQKTSGPSRVFAPSST